MSLFDRHKPSGEFFPVRASPVVQQQVHQHHSSNDVDREIFNKVLQQRDAALQKKDENFQGYLAVRGTSLERRAINAGLRAALREALKALREQNPKHSLLDKAYRQKLFNAYEKQEQERINADQLADKDLTRTPLPSFNSRPNEHLIEDV